MSNGVVRNALGTNNPSGTNTIAESSNSDLSSEITEEDWSGVCDCGSCTVGSFLQNMACSRPSQIPALSLPFVDLTHLDSLQRQLLLGRLYLEYTAIVNRFGKLKSSIQQLLREKKVTFSNLTKSIVKFESFMPSLPQEDKVQEMKKAKTASKLFTMLPGDGSFLDYHIFEDLTGVLKDDELRAKMSAYKKFVGVYCQRGIFECPSFSPTGKAGHSNFIIEIHRGQYKMSIHQLVAMQEQVCGVLGVVSNTLSICNVSKMLGGNVQVIFRVPNYVKDILVPLNAEQETALRDLGFIGWSFYNGLDISYDPAQLANQLLSSDRLTTTASNEPSRGHMSHSHDSQRIEDLSSEDDDDDDSLPRKKLKPAPGKKTRGRVKIPMEYIKNKLRRYTTFSKRKSNIMKKAYELSTLTGTQVMLMVASETGHVYTFATPKLQPMITSEAGKALIQTCLHQPEPAISATGNGVNHTQERVRMCSSGYEETDLGGYMTGGDDGKNKLPTSTVSSPLPSSMSHGMPSMYNPPPPSLPLSLANELLPTGILHSLVTSSVHSALLPPSLISPDGFSPGTADEEEEQLRERAISSTRSPGS